jgi:UPF0755 protein
VAFVVAQGETGRDVAQRLFDQGLIKDPRLFRYYVAEEGITLETGEYLLNETMTPFEIAGALQHGRAEELVLTVPEGRRIEEIADLAEQIGIDRAEFLALATMTAHGSQTINGLDFEFLTMLPADATLEGYLFPDTYLLPEDATALDLIDRMLSNFDSRVTLGLRELAATQGLTLHQVVILASIIEREAVLPEERPTIASVYLNRLASGMKLDADPTVQYPLGQPGEWWPQITIDDYVSVDSLWNTYLHSGLPPTPIANPGLEAIKAVLAPAETQFLFFMRDCEAGDGSHLFAFSEEEHLANYARCVGQ